MAGIVFPISYKIDDADLKNAEGSFKSFAGNIAGILGGLGIAASIGGALKTGFTEAMDASAGVAQLASGIKSTGGAAGVTVSHLEDLASSIQNYSGQTDDSIVKTEQLLLTFTNIKNAGPDKIFDQATTAAADMAAKMGTDASSAAIQLGKALNDPTKGISALTRVGVSFTDGQKESIKAMQASGDVAGAQKVILGELTKEFGGAAEAAGKSMPGQIEIAKRTFEDLTQGLVEQLLPAIQGIISAGQDMLVWAKENKELISGLAVAITIGAAAFGAYKLVVEGITVATKVWSAIQIAQKLITGEATLAQLGLNTALLANPIGIVVAAVAALVAGLVYFFTQTKQGQEAWKAFTAFMTDAWTNFSKFLSDSWDNIIAFFNAAWDTIGTIFKTAFDFLVTLFLNFTLPGLIISHFTEIKDFFKKIFDDIGKWFSDLWAGAVKIWNDFVKTLRSGITGVGKFFDDVWNSIADTATDIFKGIAGVITGVFHGIVGVVKGAINNVIDTANIAIGIVNGVLSAAKSITGGAVNLRVPTIPHLANGGIIPATPGGQLALIGEGGQDEAVIPLNKMGSMGGSVINLTVNAGLGSNGVNIARDIISTLKQYERTNGAVWQSA